MWYYWCVATGGVKWLDLLQYESLTDTRHHGSDPRVLSRNLWCPINFLTITGPFRLKSNFLVFRLRRGRFSCVCVFSCVCGCVSVLPPIRQGTDRVFPLCESWRNGYIGCELCSNKELLKGLTLTLTPFCPFWHLMYRGNVLYLKTS